MIAGLGLGYATGTGWHPGLSRDRKRERHHTPLLLPVAADKKPFVFKLRRFTHTHTKARLMTYPVRGLHYGPTLKVFNARDANTHRSTVQVTPPN